MASKLVPPHGGKGLVCCLLEGAAKEAELKKAEARQAELSREYNNGEPEKQGGEARNYQKYLDRVAELKSELARNESDIAGIRRELARLPAAK